MLKAVRFQNLAGKRLFNFQVEGSLVTSSSLTSLLPVVIFPSSFSLLTPSFPSQRVGKKHFQVEKGDFKLKIFT